MKQLFLFMLTAVTLLFVGCKEEAKDPPNSDDSYAQLSDVGIQTGVDYYFSEYESVDVNGIVEKELLYECPDVIERKPVAYFLNDTTLIVYSYPVIHITYEDEYAPHSVFFIRTKVESEKLRVTKVVGGFRTNSGNSFMYTENGLFYMEKRGNRMCLVHEFTDRDNNHIKRWFISICSQ